MSIRKSTILRLALILLTLINIILEKCGLNLIPMDEYVVGEFIETAIEIGIIAVGFWKNNSFTEKAIKADEFLKELRDSE